MKKETSAYPRELRAALQPDLVDYFCEDGSGLVDHPLMRFSVTTLEDADSANKFYDSKLDDSQQAATDGDWSTYLSLHERPHRLDALIEIQDELTDKLYWELLGSVWVDTEFPWQNQSEWKTLWSSSRPEKQFAMSMEEREALALLPDELTIYRGAGIRAITLTVSRGR